MKPVWAANHGEKANEGPFQVKLQSDGNLVVTQGKGQPIWTSGTMNMGEAPRELVVQVLSNRCPPHYCDTLVVHRMTATWSSTIRQRNLSGRQRRTRSAVRIRRPSPCQQAQDRRRIHRSSMQAAHYLEVNR